VQAGLGVDGDDVHAPGGNHVGELP
jgi:hypothetical protein